MILTLAKYEGRLVEVISQGAFVSCIRYTDDNMTVIEYVENNELDFKSEDDE
jgi:hypothetical protein